MGLDLWGNLWVNLWVWINGAGSVGQSNRAVYGAIYGAELQGNLWGWIYGAQLWGRIYGAEQ